MKNIVKILIAMICCVVHYDAFAYYDEDGVALLWWIDENDTLDRKGGEIRIVHDGDGLIFIDQIADGAVNGARVLVDGVDNSYLDIYHSGTIAYQNKVMPIDLDQLYNDGTAGPVWTDLGIYSSVEYSFLVELGRWEGGNWTALAASEPTTFQMLVDGGWTTSNPLNYPRMERWAPEFYTYSSPEPSSLTLCLIGFSLLMLKRKVK